MMKALFSLSFFLSFSLFLSPHLSFCISLSLSAFVSVLHISVFPFYQFVCLTICLRVIGTLHPSFLSSSVSVYHSLCPSVCLPLYAYQCIFSICLYLSLSI